MPTGSRASCGTGNTSILKPAAVSGTPGPHRPGEGAQAAQLRAATGAAGTVDRNLVAACEAAGAATVVVVFVGQEYRVHVGRRTADHVEPPLQFPAREPGIQKQAAVRTLHDRGVAAAPRPEYGGPEPGGAAASALARVAPGLPRGGRQGAIAEERKLTVRHRAALSTPAPAASLQNRWPIQNVVRLSPDSLRSHCVAKSQCKSTPSILTVIPKP